MTPVQIPLEELRESKGWSQAELARRSGVGQATISRIEAGTRRIDLDVLEKLANALEVNAVVLVRHVSGPVGATQVARRVNSDAKRGTYRVRCAHCAKEFEFDAARTTEDSGTPMTEMCRHCKKPNSVSLWSH